MIVRFLGFDDVGDFDNLVVPGILRNDDLVVDVVGDQIGDIAAGDRRDDLLHQRRKRDEAVVDRVAARLLVIGDDFAKRRILLGDKALGPPHRRGAGGGIGDIGSRQRPGRGNGKRAAQHRTPGRNVHLRLPSSLLAPRERRRVVVAVAGANIERSGIRLKLLYLLIIAAVWHPGRAVNRRVPNRPKARAPETAESRRFPRQSDAEMTLGLPATPRDQLCAIGYLAKIASICLYAFSAAASGVIPLRMTSAQAALHTWVFWTSA